MKLRNYLIVLVGCLLIACATNESEVNKDLLKLKSFKTIEPTEVEQSVNGRKAQMIKSYTTAQLEEIFNNYDRAINKLSTEIVTQQIKHNSFEVATNDNFIDLQSEIDGLNSGEVVEPDPIVVDPVVLSYPPSEVGEYPDTRQYDKPYSVSRITRTV